MSISLGALLLVLASSLAWGGFDTSRKVLAERIRPLPLLFLLTTASAPLFAIWLAVDGMPDVATGYLLPAAGSVVLNVGANLAYIEAVRRSALSLTIPLLSLTPVFTALLAIPLLGERPMLVQAAGILLVVLGALILSLPAEDRLSPAGALRAWRREPGALWMIVVALLWSLSGPLDKLAMGQSSGPFHGLMLHLGVAAATLLILAVWRKLGELSDARGAGLPFLAAIGLGSLALALQLMAYQFLWVSLVETLKRGIGNLLAVLFGRLVFAEAITLRKLVAVTLMAAGVALILV